MTEFNIDGSKRFSENCSAFLENAREIDSEMAEILSTNWDNLLKVVHVGERDTKARATFNEAIAAALDELLKKSAEAGSK
jgi:hypothetical protein